MKRRPQIRRSGRGFSLGEISEQIDVPSRVLREYVDSGELVAGEDGLYDWGQIVVLQRAHPDLLNGRANS